MFSYSGPFKDIACPGGPGCKLLNCIFSHATEYAQTTASVPSIGSELPLRGDDSDGVNSPARKRQRRSASPTVSGELFVKGHGSDKQVKAVKSPSNGAQRSMKPAMFAQSEMLKTGNVPSEHHPANPRSTEKEVSPPPLKNSDRTSSKVLDPVASNGSAPLKRKRVELKEETLAPRMVPKPPTSHAMRSKLLNMLHEQMHRLNTEVMSSSDPWKEALALSSQELVHLALNEEERAAKSNASVYANVLKLRIAALKKMKCEAWKAARIKQIEDDQPGQLKNPAAPVSLSTGLTDQEEIAMLPMLVTPQQGLAKHGYMTSEIGPKALEEARKGVEASHGYEVCDRCGTRFQVFPGRREDGTLTTGGSCVYHSGRVRRAAREANGPVQPEKYSCCDSLLGSAGCATSQSHVFKASDPARLALVLPFQRTPGHETNAASTAVCFDCEMGYTTMGMELIRLTATSWPDGSELMDVLVRPIGEILDLNSTFSGVWPQHFTEALPYDSNVADNDAEPKLRIVSSPSAARDLLFNHLTPTTPLMGHALENDLNAVRIIHPTIIDTVLLYPHPRGLPLRYGLKYLMKKHLEKDIQMGGALGHDSKEDARAAGELIRLKVKQKWDSMRREGWTVKDGDFHPPKPKQ